MNSLLMLQNAHLRMCVDSQGGSLLSLVSLQHQQAILREGHGQQPGDCGLFPMLPVANRVAGNRFMLRGEEVVLPQHGADDTFSCTVTAGCNAGRLSLSPKAVVCCSCAVGIPVATTIRRSFAINWKPRACTPR